MARSVHAVAGILLMAVAFGCSLEGDPKVTVTVVVTGIPSKADSEQVEQALKEMVGGPVRYTSSTWTGDTLTIRLSPVVDFQAFSRNIKFGKVTESQGGTVKVEFAKPRAGTTI
jgi:hypothetical protein